MIGGGGGAGAAAGDDDDDLANDGELDVPLIADADSSQVAAIRHVLLETAEVGMRPLTDPARIKADAMTS